MGTSRRIHICVEIIRHERRQRDQNLSSEYSAEKPNRSRLLSRSSLCTVCHSKSSCDRGLFPTLFSVTEHTRSIPNDVLERWTLLFSFFSSVSNGIICYRIAPCGGEAEEALIGKREPVSGQRSCGAKKNHWIGLTRSSCRCSNGSREVCDMSLTIHRTNEIRLREKSLMSVFS